jgi:alpha,alpha-trehalase
MKKFLTIFLIAVGSFSFAQQPANEGSKNKPIKNNPVKKLKEQPATPDKIWKALFTDIQVKKVLGDNKTFVDAVPKFAPEIIFKKYNSQKNNSGFDLKNFVTENFFLPLPSSVEITKGLSLKEHLEQLWGVLTRNADKKQPYSSLLPLPYMYVVPGGRFREIYYWDSYFTMQGLAVSNRYDLIGNMLDNFKYLIDVYGHIPNGNRSYYLSRSQPPYFALMVNLFAEKNGDAVYKKYFFALEKEYKWWMEGEQNLKPGEQHRRAVKLADGNIVNRYWDDKKAPREESYVQDVESAKVYKASDGMAFTNLRAGAESGWDFSSRWFADTFNLNTIETTNIIPVDLNCLLYAYENILSKASAANGTTTNRWAMAGVLPLFVNIARADQAEGVKKNIEEKFLKDGGLLTTPYHTGQQWDAPNGWAPLQFLAVKGLMNYQFGELAKNIAQRWMAVNEKVFASTGKMMEKYNVENTHLESGGGEYPTQDGFGWSNGVYLKFYQMFKSK